MLYFKNKELAEKYHVSLGTVRNWIEATQDGKLDLVLQTHEGKPYVANTASNIASIERMAEDGKKYRNTRAVKTITPKPEFYDLLTRRQMLDIISSLTVNHEIDLKYNYMGEGADHWEEYAQWAEEQTSQNSIRGTIDLTRANLPAIDSLLGESKRVNIIDLGPGNARPSKDLIAHVLKRGLLHRYIAIDISQAMLDIAERNIKKWFGDEVKFEGYIRDLNYDRFDDLTVDDLLGRDAAQTINLILLLGGTSPNFNSFADPLRVAYGSMSVNDLIIYTGRPDTETSRRYFDFNPMPGAGTISPHFGFTLDLLNIDPSLYEVEMGYDQDKRMRLMSIRLTTALTIRFKFDTGERHVNLEKDQKIVFFHAWHRTTVEVISEFHDCGFALLQAGTTKDRGYLLTVFGLDAKRTT
jgi:hypothetical protein